MLDSKPSHKDPDGLIAVTLSDALSNSLFTEAPLSLKVETTKWH
jgi:hypothetical protein